MAIQYYAADRVWETTTGTGTGNLTLGGAKAGYSPFSRFGSSSFFYCVTDGTDFEVGYGTVSGGALVRTTVTMTAAGNNTPVNWGAGTKDVFAVIPSAWFRNFNYNLDPAVYSIASGAEALALGGGTAAGERAIAFGNEAYASAYGSFARSVGVIDNGGAGEGMAQDLQALWRGATTDAVQTEIFLDGASARLGINQGDVYAFEVSIVGAQYAGSAGTKGDAFSVKKHGLIKRLYSGSAALVGTVTTEWTHNDSAAATWTATVEADATNNALIVKVTGEANKSINWFAEAKIQHTSWTELAG